MFSFYRQLSDKQKSIVSMLLSALGFSLMGVFVKLAGDIPTVQKAIFRSGVIMMIAYLTFRRIGLRLTDIRNYKLLTARSVLGTIGILLNYYALDHLLLSDANVIFRLSTIFLLLSSYLFLHEKLKYYEVLSIIIAFIGILLVIKPAFNFQLFPYLIAILGALFAALAYTTLRPLGKLEHPVSIILFFSGFTTLVLAPYVIVHWVPMNLLQLLFTVAAGFCAYLGQVGLTIAYKYSPAKEVSIYNYFGLIFSSLFGILFFQSFPDWLSIGGYLLVFFSSYYMYRKTTAA